MRDVRGAIVRDLPDPFGGTFDASGDFDELLGRGACPMLNAIDLYGMTTLGSSEMAGVVHEVDALLAAIPEVDRVAGRKGSAWRGLTRFRVMAAMCGADNCLTLRFDGD